MNGQLTLVTEQSWSERARAWIERLDVGDGFTAEALRRSVGEPEDANQIGAAITWASRKHLIRYAREDRRTERPIARGRYLRVWERVA